MKNFLNVKDLSKEDFFKIIEFSNNLYCLKNQLLKDKNIGLIFEKNSTRTRLSFQAGINQLGGNYIDIKLDELNLNRFESYEDTFKMMNCYLDAIVFRTTDHKKLVLASKYFHKPIINALSDVSHPCQAISDFFTLKEHFHRLENLKICWMGDLNNVLVSLLESGQFFEGLKFNIFTDKNIYNDNKKYFENFSNANFFFNLDHKVINDSNCVMTDVYNSMNDKYDKEAILKKFQVNEELMSYTNDNAVFMHCLPAKVNSEVTKNVLESSKSIVLKQAENRLHAQKGIMKWLNI